LANIRVLSEQEGQSLLLCPQCGYEFLHITKVSVHRGEDKITITGDNISIDEQKNTSRGVIIVIEYEGECVHRGEIILHFCKGNVYVYHDPLEDRPIDEHGMFKDSKDEIFRD